MYNNNWIPDSKMVPIHFNGVARLAHMQKKSKLPGLLPLNMCHSVSPTQFTCSAERIYIVMTSQVKTFLFSAWGKFFKYKKSVDLIFGIGRVITNLVCSSRCPVTSFTNISFTVLAYKENPFLEAGGFFVAIRRVGTVVWAHFLGAWLIVKTFHTNV